MADILCISHSAELSGATLSLLRIAEYLAGKGHRITVSFPGETGSPPPWLDMTGIATVVIPNPELSLAETPGLGHRIKIFRSRIHYMRQMWDYVRSSKFDLVYVNSSMAVYGGLAARFAGKRVVWHIREDLQSSWGNRFRISIIKRAAQRVIFVCRKISRVFGDPPRGRKWFVVPNPVDASKLQVTESRESICRNLDVPPESPLIINVGFVTHRKGIDILLRALGEVVKSFPTVRLLIVGDHSDTPRDYWDSLQEFIRSHNLEQAVRFTGFRGDVNRLLHAADLFVLSSRNEAMPVCVLEAMAAGRPIVATDVDAISEMLDDGNAGIIVPPDNVPSLADAMTQLLSDPDRMEALSRTAQERAFTLHNPETIYPQIERILLETLQ